MLLILKEFAWQELFLSKLLAFQLKEISGVSLKYVSQSIESECYTRLEKFFLEDVLLVFLVEEVIVYWGMGVDRCYHFSSSGRRPGVWKCLFTFSFLDCLKVWRGLSWDFLDLFLAEFLDFFLLRFLLNVYNVEWKIYVGVILKCTRL